MSTLSDVAREARVSTITVSRVINMPEKVKPATRERVQRAMEKVHYVQNPVAKALVSKRVGIIDVYVPQDIDLSNPFVMHMIGGVSEALSRQMYSFLIIRDRLHEHKCDGYIVTGLLKNELQEMHQYAMERKRPIALFGHTDNEDIDCVDVDNVEGVRRITRRLLENGHRTLAMINVDEDKDYTAQRYEGYCQALREAGNPSAERVVSAQNHMQGGYGAMKTLLQTSPGLDAVVCATDDLAIGAVRAAIDEGVPVPEDISVTGYDGLGHHLLSNPSITTMQQPVYEIGRRLAEVLVNRIQGEQKRVREYIVPELVIEHSDRQASGNR